MSVLFLALVLGGVVLGLVALAGLVLLGLKIVAIIGEAGKPIHQDQGSYSLNQGREVRPEEEQS